MHVAHVSCLVSHVRLREVSGSVHSSISSDGNGLVLVEYSGSRIGCCFSCSVFGSWDR